MKSSMRIPTVESRSFKNEKLASFLKPNLEKEEEKYVKRNIFNLITLYRRPVLK